MPNGGSRNAAMLIPKEAFARFRQLFDTSADYALAKYIPVTPSWGYAQGRAVTRSIYPNCKDGFLVFIEFNFKL
jgi:hypothetical protein